MADWPYSLALKRRVRLESPTEQPDGYGNTTAGWTARFERRCEIRPMRGGEAVIGARLAGTTPALIVMRADVQTRAIGTDWRAVDARTGRVWAIRQSEAMEADGRRWTLLVEAGGAI